MITLITGGVRSGKSRYALELAMQHSGPKCFMATAEAFDEEMKERIQKHQTERGPEWTTVEAPLHLAAALRQHESSYQFMVVDCLTLWINNLLHYQTSKGLDIETEIRQLEDALKDAPIPVAIVTNEVGLGIMPESPLSRRCADLLGSLNQRMARLADHVILMVAGIPMEIKTKVTVTELL